VPERVEIRREPADGPAARPLVKAMEEEMDALYGGSILDWPSATPADFGPPGGVFVVVYEDGRPVACGGVKRLGPEVGEIKRMYVVPDARSRGHARRLLDGLEAAARELGYVRTRLDTGDRQPHALALYESAGYRGIGDYNGNPFASYWAEKAL
jgi:GNAT superfamily N-acetyltransferase